MRPSQLFSIFEREFIGAKQGSHTPVMVWGPPGIGKSQLVADVAVRHGVPIIDVRLSQMEPSDLRGIPFRTEDRVEWAVPAMLPHETRHGPAGILFLDEICSAAPTVSAAAYQLILDRRLGEYQVPDGWAIFAAGNRQGDHSVTYAMPAPLANRFSHYELEVNLDDWIVWAYAKGIDARLIAFLRFRPELLFDFDPAQNPIAFPSPRSWEFAHRALQKFGDRVDLMVGSLQACVGPAAGIEFSAYIDNLDNLPDLDAIVRGEVVGVPESIDLQYAVASSLVARAIQANETGAGDEVIGHILDYATLFPQREMGIMLVSDMHRAIGESLFGVPQFEQWAARVADVMLFDG